MEEEFNELPREDEIRAPKKRGRKPKVHAEESSDTAPKPRGRKKKVEEQSQLSANVQQESQGIIDVPSEEQSDKPKRGRRGRKPSYQVENDTQTSFDLTGEKNAKQYSEEKSRDDSRDSEKISDDESASSDESEIFVHHEKHDEFGVSGGYEEYSPKSDGENGDNDDEIPQYFSTSDEDLKHDSYRSERDDSRDDERGNGEEDDEECDSRLERGADETASRDASAEKSEENDSSLKSTRYENRREDNRNQDYESRYDSRSDYNNRNPRNGNYRQPYNNRNPRNGNYRQPYNNRNPQGGYNNNNYYNNRGNYQNQNSRQNSRFQSNQNYRQSQQGTGNSGSFGKFQNQRQNQQKPQQVRQLQSNALKKKVRWAHLANNEGDLMNPAELPDWEVLKSPELLNEYVSAYLGDKAAIENLTARAAEKNQPAPFSINKNEKSEESKAPKKEEISNEENTENNSGIVQNTIAQTENAAKSEDEILKEAASKNEQTDASEDKNTDKTSQSENLTSENVEQKVEEKPTSRMISIGDWRIECPIEEPVKKEQDTEDKKAESVVAPCVSKIETPSIDDNFFENKEIDFNALNALDLRALQTTFDKNSIPYRRGQGKSQMFADLFKYVRGQKKLLRFSGTLDIFEDAQGGAICYPSDSYELKSDCVFVPKMFIDKYALQRGHEVCVTALPPRENATDNCPIAVRIESVMGLSPDNVRNLVPFTDLTPYYPTRRMIMEADSQCGWDNISMRVVDLLTPVGLGQRALIVAPPRTGKTVLLQGLAKSIRRNTPEAHVIVLLVDERPEEVTDFRRNVDAEVIASTFDADALSHVHAAEMVISKARRMVETGKDVVILLDSITRLARAYNALMPNGGRTMSGGIEVSALQKPKRFFGSARNIEGGGSLTIIGTALVETGSKMDDVIFEEFKGTGNLELHLDRGLSDKRIFPSINMEKSGTRKEELLYHPDELPKIYTLRRAMKGVASTEAMELLLQRLKKVKTNIEFLMGLNR